ncbi:MAG: radical SAM protein [Lachnospiraceae bacterium]|nr:radical SAM protein [Lachnospiraceae bacterium]
MKMEYNSEKYLYVHSFESMAALDGEGIRYGVFLTGCPLRCVYCHNPDTWAFPGTPYTPKSLADKISRYKPYFGDKGGVTFSGGEPLLSAAGINATAIHLREYGIQYALDTSGCIPLSDDVKTVVRGADMIICDLKMWNDEAYIKYTGTDMSLVLGFLGFAAKSGVRLWIRTVIVPGINDSEDIMDKYLTIVLQFHPEKYELLGFHTMGFYKYDNLGITNPLAGAKPLDNDTLHRLQSYCNAKL